jgi:hypothetical protein
VTARFERQLAQAAEELARQRGVLRLWIRHLGVSDVYCDLMQRGTITEYGVDNAWRDSQLARAHASELSMLKKAIDAQRAENEVLQADCHDGGCRACAACCDDMEERAKKAEAERDALTGAQHALVIEGRRADELVKRLEEHQRALHEANLRVEHAERRIESARQVMQQESFEGADVVAALEGPLGV